MMVSFFMAFMGQLFPACKAVGGIGAAISCFAGIAAIVLYIMGSVKIWSAQGSACRANDMMKEGYWYGASYALVWIPLAYYIEMVSLAFWLAYMLFTMKQKGTDVVQAPDAQIVPESEK